MSAHAEENGSLDRGDSTGESVSKHLDDWLPRGQTSSLESHYKLVRNKEQPGAIY